MLALIIYILPFFVFLICTVAIPFIFLWSWLSLSQKHKKQKHCELNEACRKEELAKTIRHTEDLIKEQNYHDMLYARHQIALKKYREWSIDQLRIFYAKEQPQYQNMSRAEFDNFIESQKETKVRYFMGDDTYSAYLNMITQIEERTRKMRESL